MECQKLRVNWLDHLSHFKNSLPNFLERQILCDVTITAEGKLFKAHQFILSACSPYFEKIFIDTQNTNNHVTIFCHNVSSLEIELMLSYIYKGEVVVPRNLMESFLKTCESLQIEGIFNKDNQTGSENIENISDEFHSAQNTQHTMEDLVQIVNETTEQTGKVDKNSNNDQSSFVFSLSEDLISERDGEIGSQAIIFEEKPVEILVLSEDDGDDLEINSEKMEKLISSIDIIDHPLDTEAISDLDELLVSSPKTTTFPDYLTDDSEICIPVRNQNNVKKTNNKLNQLKMASIQKAKALKVILNRIPNTDTNQEQTTPDQSDYSSKSKRVRYDTAGSSRDESITLVLEENTEASQKVEVVGSSENAGVEDQQIRTREGILIEKDVVTNVDSDDECDGIYVSKEFDSFKLVPMHLIRQYCMQCKRCVRKDLFREHMHKHSVEFGYQFCRKHRK